MFVGVVGQRGRGISLTDPRNKTPDTGRLGKSVSRDRYGRSGAASVTAVRHVKGQRADG